VEQAAEGGSRLGPQWTEPFLAALAAEANESESIQLQIFLPDIEDFLHASARVEQSHQQRPITEVIRPLRRDGVKHGGDFASFEIVDGTSGSALEGYGQETLRLLHVLRIPGREEASKGMNCGQAGVAGGHAILSLRFEMIQKDKDILRTQMLELQIDDPTAVMRGEKAKEQYERIAVTQHRPRTEPTGEWQMLGEERTEGGRELRGRRWRHRWPPSRLPPKSHVDE
jgi:hypothetical protein